MQFSEVTRVGAVAGCAVLVGGVLAVGPAFASGPNRGRVWESGIGGIKVNAQIWIQPSYNDHGKHAAGGQVHLWRTAGPAVVAYGYTPAARSIQDSRILTVKKTVRDSILPGAAYVTHGAYKTSWFGGGSCLSSESIIGC